MTIQTIKTRILPVLTRYPVRRAGIFGSTVRNERRNDSDIDLLVELKQPMGLLAFVGIKQDLEEVLGVSVDLVEYRSLKPQLRERILAEEIPVYG